eukprot:TRINITY_DN5244_c0_g2_i1.p1 TRINITY_DN5244_c0_g2~~TRINITY_DN5244_c0_g2_i1.p1  ORF type:complete len:390 (-),score=151.03 TRINITY_DN5244_c0_g2_i1:546-1715(-)
MAEAGEPDVTAAREEEIAENGTANEFALALRSAQLNPFLRVLVTGGAGFLGSHLCRRLLAAGHEVICLDNFFTSQKLNIVDLMDHPNFEFVRHDVTVPFFAEVDRIFNLACPASPVHYQYNPIKTAKISFCGALNMLGLAKRVRARILQASTSEVYGDAQQTPQTEQYWGNVNPIGVRACYDEGKRVAETLFLDYHRQHGVQIRVARIFNTYGPSMHPYDGRVVSNFIMQALANDDITIYGSGTQTRSFCFVDDLVDGLLRLMDSDMITPVNLGNPNEFTILELAQLIIKLAGSKSRVINKPLPQDDPKQRKPDITVAMGALDWQPRTQLEEGLRATIEYFRHLDMRKFKKPTEHNAHANSEHYEECMRRVGSPTGDRGRCARAPTGSS